MSCSDSSYQRESSSESKLPSITVGKRAATGLFEHILCSGASLRVRVTGMSMVPFLGDEEIVTVKKVPSESLQRGDVILFRDDYGCALLHRLIGKRHVGDDTVLFQTKGDARVTFDEPILSDSVIGKVCTIERAAVFRSRSINMESYRWRTINYFIAAFHLVRSKLRNVLRRICGIRSRS